MCNGSRDRLPRWRPAMEARTVDARGGRSIARAVAAGAAARPGSCSGACTALAALILVADRLLLRPPARRGAAGASTSSASSASPSTTTGTSSQEHLRRAAAARRHADHLGDRAAHRRAGRGRDARSTSPSCARGALRAAADDRWSTCSPRCPSVVYGLWGFFVLIPQAPAGRAVVLRHVLVPAVRRRPRRRPQLLHRRADPRDHDPADRLARSRARSSPRCRADHKEAALALGATRWEMIRMAVLPYSRSGHRRRARCSASAARSARRSR